MVTAMNCLTLQVYYRYLPLYQLDGQGPRETIGPPDNDVQ
jgi:hypothetical protein